MALSAGRIGGQPAGVGAQGAREREPRAPPPPQVALGEGASAVDLAQLLPALWAKFLR